MPQLPLSGTGDGIAITGNGYAAGGAYDFITIPSGICQPPATAVSTGNPVDRSVGLGVNHAPEIYHRSAGITGIEGTAGTEEIAGSTCIARNRGQVLGLGFPVPECE